MAVFKRFGDQMARAGQKTMQKTKALTELTRLNAVIEDAEQVVREQYAEIGRLYASLHADDYEAPFTAAFALIKQAQNDANEARQQINRIKGLRSCPNCGCDCDRDAVFCSACGAQLAQPEPSYTCCPHCGTPMAPDARFCSSCGLPVEAQPGRCSRCGVALEADSRFCSACGASVAPM